MSAIDRMVDAVSASHKMSKADARDVVQVVLDKIENELQRDGECAIPKWGKFTLIKRDARAGHNPRTGEPVEIAAKTGIRFKAAKALAARFNEGTQAEEEKAA